MTVLPRILVVDYDPKALKKLEDLFCESGYEVETAKDGVAALAAFRRSKPDVILLEAMIPRKHGFEVCQEIKKTPEGKSVPVIIHRPESSTRIVDHAGITHIGINRIGTDSRENVERAIVHKVINIFIIVISR